MGLRSEHESDDTRRGEWRSNGRAAAARGLLRILSNSRRAPRRTARRGSLLCAEEGAWKKMEQGGALFGRLDGGWSSDVVDLGRVMGLVLARRESSAPWLLAGARAR
jgi:hypothetical protein